MQFIQLLPMEIQWAILKYLSYSPTSKLIKENSLSTDRARELYDNLEKFKIFHTNVYKPIERIFNPTILKYIRLSHYNLNIPNNRQSYYQRKLIQLNTIYYNNRKQN